MTPGLSEADNPSVQFRLLLSHKVGIVAKARQQHIVDGRDILT